MQKQQLGGLVMLEFVFDIPLLISGPVIIAILFLFSLIGLRFVRRRVLPGMQIDPHDMEFTGAMVHSIMIFYGLAVGLMAVNVTETYNEVSGIISAEASAIGALYRDVSSYPDPIRGELQQGLRTYTDYTINTAWPMQKKGQVPSAGVEIMNQFQGVLDKFEPVTEGQKILHAETLRAYNQMMQARRLRLDSVNTGMPGVMWSVIVFGAFISLFSSFFFKVRDARLHRNLVVLLALFIGLVIFMVLALDKPYRGDLGLTPEPYQLIYDHLMKIL